MVGPNFHRPTVPHIKQYTLSQLPAKTASASASGALGKAQHFIDGRDVPNEWWTVFHSKPLNQLIDAGLGHSPTLQAAKAALTQAQEARRAEFGALLLPSLDGQYSGQRQRTNASSFGLGSSLGSSEFTLYNASVSVSYVFDLFGGARRELERYTAQVHYQQFQWEAAYLTLTTSIVTTVINLASLEAQISALEKIIDAEQKQLHILNQQFSLGSASGADVAAQETLTAQTRALLPPLQKSLAQSRHSLAVLVGEFPNHKTLHRIDLSELHLPTALPISLPSALVRQRPDIRAQEALLHAASAQVGVATANLFPQITLAGGYGWTNDKLSNLFSPSHVVWNASAGVLQPLFRGGALLSQRRASIAAYQQAAALYRETVLHAFQNVADTLEALKSDANALAAQDKAASAAQKTLTITQKQYALGGTSYLTLLNAQRQYLQADINRIQAQATRLADTAALYQALGGGWWQRQSDKPTPVTHISYRRFSR